jgi:hypothetical protein
MMQQILIILAFRLSLDDDHFENGEDMDAQLNHEEHLEFGTLLHGPIRIVHVDCRAVS